MTFGSYCRLAVPICVSDRAVIRAARGRMTAAARRDRSLREERRRFYAAMLRFHQGEQDTARQFRL